MILEDNCACYEVDVHCCICFMRLILSFMVCLLQLMPVSAMEPVLQSAAKHNMGQLIEC
jgi:hypothetical protein